MGCCEMFGKMVETDSLQPVLCGLLKMLFDGAGSLSSDPLTVDEDFLFLVLALGMESYGSFQGKGVNDDNMHVCALHFGGPALTAFCDSGRSCYCMFHHRWMFTV